jgi:hypothetical protein
VPRRTSAQCYSLVYSRRFNDPVAKKIHGGACRLREDERGKKEVDRIVEGRVRGGGEAEWSVEGRVKEQHLVDLLAVLIVEVELLCKPTVDFCMVIAAPNSRQERNARR